MLVLFGKSASGKDTLADMLCRYYDFYRRIEVTTRQMRPNECQGNPYAFVDNEQFKELRTSQSLIAYKSFVHIVNKKKKKVYYGIPKIALEQKGKQDSLITSNVEMAMQLKKKIRNTPYKNQIQFVEITCNDNVRLERLIKRGTPQEELERRMRDENIVYKHSDLVRDFMVDNTTNTPKETAELIYRLYTSIKRG